MTLLRGAIYKEKSITSLITIPRTIKTTSTVDYTFPKPLSALLLLFKSLHQLILNSYLPIFVYSAASHLGMHDFTVSLTTNNVKIYAFELSKSFMLFVKQIQIQIKFLTKPDFFLVYTNFDSNLRSSNHRAYIHNICGILHMVAKVTEHEFPDLIIFFF